MCVSVFLAPFCHFFRCWCCWKENDKRETMGDRNGLGSSSGGGGGEGGVKSLSFM